jgi:hypothetical protein
MLCSTSKESLQKIQWEDLKEDVECTGSACAAEALLRHSTIQKERPVVVLRVLLMLRIDIDRDLGEKDRSNCGVL